MELKKQITRLKIDKKYLPFVEDFKTNIIAGLKKAVHSIYMCGSIATGKAKPYQSDADFTIVTNTKLSENEKDHINVIKQQLLEKYPFNSNPLRPK